MNTLKKAIENGTEADKVAGRDNLALDILLGSKDAVQDIADLAKNRKTALEILREDRLRAYNQSKSYTREENEAYRQAQNDILGFFYLCENEIYPPKQEDLTNKEDT